MIRKRILALATAIGVALSAAALAQDARTTSNANVRAGPATDFPVVANLARGTPVHIAGCLSGYQWCDVEFGGNRGWIASRLLQTSYQSRVVPLDGYGATIGLPIISFALGNYWDDHYRDRSWYSQRPRWEQRWSSRGHSASRYSQGAPRIDYPRDQSRFGPDRHPQPQNPQLEQRGNRLIERQGNGIIDRTPNDTEHQGQ